MYAYIYKYLIKLPTKLGKYTKLKCKMMENALPQKDFPVLNLLIFRFTVLECFFLQFQVDHATHLVVVWQVRTKSCPRTQDLEKHPSVENRLHAWWMYWPQSVALKNAGGFCAKIK